MKGRNTIDYLGKNGRITLKQILMKYSLGVTGFTLLSRRSCDELF
jgi:hypothetical protein